MALYKLVFNFNFNEEGKKTQVLQQEAYPAIWPPVDVQNLAIPGAIPPKWEKTCPRCGQTAVQNFPPIGKAPAENPLMYKWVNLVFRLYYGIAG